MSVIDNAVKHFDAQDVRVTLVPEWGEESEPLKIYSKPLTLSETSKLYKMSQNDDLTMMAFVLIYKALNGEGEKKLLNSVDREVLIRVAQEIMGQEPIEETKKD